ncbi:MAG: YeeE/YedE family protein [Magnetospirillum sp.]|nr:YeeE/YedE family protein [Magnetospirillum sp.]
MSNTWLSGFKADYKHIFVDEWSPFVGIILVVLVILALMVNGLFWGIFGGLKLWGDWVNNAIGLGGLLGLKPELDSPLTHRMSLMNLTLVIGAFTAALLSRQFAINRPPPLEYLWAALGGSLMGIGAALAGGCTTGGFFTPVLHSSPAGWAMGLGLAVGAAIGLKLLLWTLETITWGMTPPKAMPAPAGLVARYPLLGLLVLVAILAWAANWYASDNERLAARAIIIVAGFAMGFVMHRSRLCFARAFREPYMTGEGEMSKAIMLGILIGVPLAALLFKAKLIDPYLAIPPVFWIGSLAGGLLFGIGMIFAGGCASGSLWRMGEGHLKLWVAGFFFAWAGSVSYALFKKTGLTASDMNLDLIEESPLGFQAFLPVMLDGWGWALAVGAALLVLWYALVRYNESTEKFTLL